MWLDGFGNMERNENGEPIFRAEPLGLVQIDAMMYHHDNVYFEYILPTRNEQP
jgi:hypothetical protein